MPKKMSSSAVPSSSPGGNAHNSQRAGLGVTFETKESGDIEIIGLKPGGKAERSGAISVGDKIVSIGSVPVKGASRDAVTNLILGDAGTQVTLELLRDAGTTGSPTGSPNGQASKISVTLTREILPSGPAPGQRSGVGVPGQRPEVRVPTRH